MRTSLRPGSWRNFVAALAAGSLLGLAGCGGGGTTTVSTPPPADDPGDVVPPDDVVTPPAPETVQWPPWPWNENFLVSLT